MCDCPHPLCTTTADVYRSRRPKKNGCWTVDRWLDCLFCGPHKERIEVVDPPPKGFAGRGVRLVRPVHCCRPKRN